MKLHYTHTTPLLLAGLIVSSPVLADIESDLTRLEQEIEQIRKEAGIGRNDPSQLSLYGSFRPVLTQADDGTDTITDVRDALSRFGLTGGTSVLESSKVFFKGEWNVKIADGGQIEGARLAFVGLSGNLGQLTIGKQRPPQYSLISEHVDIFNHADSPYGYDAADDNAAPFFIDNTTMYQYQMSGLDFRVAVRTDGQSGKNAEDLVNAGLGYSIGDFYVAGAYLKSIKPSVGAADKEGDESENIAFAAYLNMNKLYIAAAYQAVTQTPETGAETDVTTLDVSASYALPSRYKVKAGVFMYDDDVTGATSAKHQGINVTLERQLADNFRIHAEYLTKDIDQGDTISAFTLGMRYDFSVDL